MTDDIKVSIIMPVYNSGIYLRPAIDSILSQSMKEYELILVDDGSTDGSEKVCDEYAQAHPEGTFPIVRVIHQKNGGICRARNVALGEARGEYIGFCDHDDMYLPGLVETAYTKAKQYNADVVKWGADKRKLKFGREVPTSRRTKYEERMYKPEDIKHMFMKMYFAGLLTWVWDGFYKREFIMMHGLKFDEFFKMGGEDGAFMLNLVGCLPVFVTLPQVYYRRVVRKGFSTSTKPNKHLADVVYRLNAVMMATINKIGVGNEETKDDIIFYLSRRYLRGVLSSYYKTTSRFSVKEFLKIIENIRTQTFLPSYFLSGDAMKVFKRDMQSGFIYYLFKHKYDYILAAFYYVKWIIR